MKKFRLTVTVLLLIIILLTTYFIMDRYIFNSDIKGISIVDIQDILRYAIIPLTISIIIIWLIEKRKTAALKEKRRK